MDEIESKVIKIIGEQLGKDEADIKLESNFVDDLEADSLDTVELVMALEENSGSTFLMTRRSRSLPFNRLWITSKKLRLLERHDQHFQVGINLNQTG